MPEPDPVPDLAEVSLADVMAALADPQRARVVRELALDASDPERTCGSFELEVAKSTRTHHFRVLQDAGLVSTTDYGNRRGVRLRRAELEARFPGLLALLVAEA